ncbi:MAG: sulfotransferase domain-containing protein [Alphaproteobacteria bacterium]|jgi:hypothetical protein|nr:sulfotransferase domain-containing protein [Alphaproteobacteria bacterium]
MGRITWLASYPKSGNTWLRVFLANYCNNLPRPFDINDLPYFSQGEMAAGLYEKVSKKRVVDMTTEELQRLRPKVHHIIASFDHRPNFVKTHNAIAMLFDVPTITSKVTKSAVYVIRNPLDIVTSYADHFGRTIDETIEQMGSSGNRTSTTEKLVFQYLASWSDHVRSWTEAPGLNAHVVKFEDMLERQTATFALVVDYLALPPDDEKLHRAIRYSSFSELRAQEESRGFYERSRNSGAFFRSGRVGQWRETLSSGQIDAIVARHGDVMSKYQYLP